MLQAILVGHLGADALVKSANGKEFTTFRVAHTDRWKDDSGIIHENVQWVDCILSGNPAVVPYLKKGTCVYISGNITTRVYSSEKDRCMKAGITISVQRIELIGGKGDEVPSRLFTTDGQIVSVTKHYYCQDVVRGSDSPEFMPLVTQQGGRYVADRNGWVFPFREPEDSTATAQPVEQTATQADEEPAKTENKPAKSKSK